MSGVNETGEKQMQIGDKVWIFDSNHRIYKDADGNKTQSPWYRGHFIERYVIGETKQSWIIGYSKGSVPDKRDIKVNKKTLTYYHKSYGMDGKLYISEERIDQLCWMNDNQYEIINMVRNCNDYQKLRLIEGILYGD